MSERTLEAELWVQKIMADLPVVDAYSVDSEAAKAHLARWQNRYATAGKIIALAQDSASMDDEQKREAVEQLTFLRNTTSPTQLLPFVRRALPTHNEGPTNAEAVASSQNWDKIRNYAYGGGAAAAPLLLNPIGAATAGLGLLTLSVADDFFITRPQFRTADDILKAAYENALVQSHEALMQREDLREVVAQAELSDAFRIYDTTPKPEGDAEAGPLDALYHRMRRLEAEGDGVKALIAEHNAQLKKSSAVTQQMFKAELTRRANAERRSAEEARIERVNAKRVRGEYDAAVKLAALAAEQLFGDAKAASIITASYEGYRQIENAISLFNAVPPAMGPIGLTLTAVSTVLNIAGIFGKSGPSPEQQILESLQAVHESLAEIKKMIADLAAHLDDRLDEIARSQVRVLDLLQAGIADILEAQDLGFNRIEIGLRKLERRLEIVRKLVVDTVLRANLDEFDADIEIVRLIQSKGRPLSANDVTRLEDILARFRVKAVPPYNWLEGEALIGPRLEDWDSNHDQIVMLLLENLPSETMGLAALAPVIAQRFGPGEAPVGAAIPHPFEWVKYALSYFEIARTFPQLARYIVRENDFKTIASEADRISGTLQAAGSANCAHALRSEYRNRLRQALQKATRRAYQDTIPTPTTAIYPGNLRSAPTEEAGGVLSPVAFLDAQMSTLGPKSFEAATRTGGVSEMFDQLIAELKTETITGAALSYLDGRLDVKIEVREWEDEVWDNIGDAEAYGHDATHEEYKDVRSMSCTYTGRHALGYDAIALAQRHGLISVRQMPPRTLRRETIQEGVLSTSRWAKGFADIVLTERLTPFEITFTNNAQIAPGQMFTTTEFGLYSYTVDFNWPKDQHRWSKTLLEGQWHLAEPLGNGFGPTPITKTSEVFALLHQELYLQQVSLRRKFLDRLGAHLTATNAADGGRDALAWRAAAGGLKYAAALNAILKIGNDGAPQADDFFNRRSVSGAILRDSTSLPDRVTAEDGGASLMQILEAELASGVSHGTVEALAADGAGLDRHLLAHILPKIIGTTDETPTAGALGLSPAILDRYVAAHWPTNAPTEDATMLSKMPLIVGNAYPLIWPD